MQQAVKDALNKFHGAIISLWNSACRLFEQEESPSFPRDYQSRDGSLDQYSETWIYVSNWAGAELARLRESNDSTKLDPAQTASLRGRIRALKDLIALPTAKDRKKRQGEVIDDDF